MIQFVHKSLRLHICQRHADTVPRCTGLLGDSRQSFISKETTDLLGRFYIALVFRIESTEIVIFADERMNGITVIIGVMMTDRAGGVAVEYITAIRIVGLMLRILAVVVTEHRYRRVAAYTCAITYVAQSAGAVTGFNSSVPVPISKTGDSTCPYIIGACAFSVHTTQRSTLTNRTAVL